MEREPPRFEREPFTLAVHDRIKQLSSTNTVGFRFGDLVRSSCGLAHGEEENTSASDVVVRFEYASMEALQAAAKAECALIDDKLVARATAAGGSFGGEYRKRAHHMQWVGRVVWEVTGLAAGGASDGPWPCADGTLTIRRGKAASLMRFVKSEPFEALLRDPRLHKLEGVSLALLDKVDLKTGQPSKPPSNPAEALETCECVDAGTCTARLVFLFRAEEEASRSMSALSTSARRSSKAYVADCCKLAGAVFGSALQPFSELRAAPEFSNFEVEYSWEPRAQPHAKVSSETAPLIAAHRETQRNFLNSREATAFSASEIAALDCAHSSHVTPPEGCHTHIAP